MPPVQPKLPKMNSIQAFQVAAEAGSLAKAAALLALTPPAVSQQIRLLEEQLHVTLFVRTRSGVKLTEAGKEYLRYVKEAFEILQLGQHNLNAERQAQRLALYCLPALASLWLLPGLASWEHYCPEVDLALHATHAHVDFNAMSANFVICFGAHQYPQLEKRRLFQDEVLPVASPALAAAINGLAGLATAPLIHLDWGQDGRFLPNWREWCQARGIAAPGGRRHLTFNLTSLAIDAAIQGHGLLLGQRRLIGPALKSGQLVVLDSLSLPLSKPYFVAWPPGSLELPGGRQLLAWLLAMAQGV